ncbi:MAG: hypothetical protein ACLGH0_08025 [Thermoanaerobaculia bacterium]
MLETTKLMTFEEFRASCNDVVRQQRSFFRDAASAEQIVRLTALSLLQWVMWKDPDGAVEA